MSSYFEKYLSDRYGTNDLFQNADAEIAELKEELESYHVFKEITPDLRETMAARERNIKVNAIREMVKEKRKEIDESVFITNISTGVKVNITIALLDYFNAYADKLEKSDAS